MKLKQREKIIIFIGSVVLLSWLWYAYGYAPKLAAAKRLKQEIALVEQNKKANQELIRNSKVLEAEIEHLQKEFSSLRSMMSGGGSPVSMIMEQLEEEPFKSEIRLVAIHPKKSKTIKDGSDVSTRPKVVYTKFSIDMELECQYNTIGPYLESLEELPMLITVEDVSIERKKDIYPYLVVNLTVSTYSIGNSAE